MRSWGGVTEGSVYAAGARGKGRGAGNYYLPAIGCQCIVNNTCTSMVTQLTKAVPKRFIRTATANRPAVRRGSASTNEIVTDAGLSWIITHPWYLRLRNSG